MGSVYVYGQERFRALVQVVGECSVKQTDEFVTAARMLQLPPIPITRQFLSQRVQANAGGSGVVLGLGLRKGQG